MQEREYTKLRGKLFLGNNGNTYSLTDLAKTSEFGGKGAGFGVRIEQQEIDSVNRDLNSPIDIKIGNNVYNNVAKLDKTPGTPKSDMHFITTDNKEAIWISHKAGKTPKDFQQYGGITGPTIKDHDEVIDFISTTKKKFGNKIPNNTVAARKIIDPNLKMKSVYGVNYGNLLGRQNVSLLVQGHIKLEANSGYYSMNTMTANIHINGAPMSNTYDPTLLVVYRGDRSQFGIQNARFSISPLGTKIIKEFI